MIFCAMKKSICLPLTFVNLVTVLARACIPHCVCAYESPRMGPCRYSCQPKQVFKDHALIFFEFLQVKNLSKQVNMQKNYHVNILIMKATILDVDLQ